MKPVRRDLLIAGVVCLLSLVAGAGALVLAEFGAPVWVFVLLLGWLVTLGLPTLAAVLLLATFWRGPSFEAFLIVAVLLALIFQFGAVLTIRHGLALRRMSGR